MSIELQIRSSILETLAARAVQQRLCSTCFPPIGSFYLDHANVAHEPVNIVGVGNAVHFRVPVNIFLVRSDDVLAAPNAVPTGATVPAGRVVVVLEMATTGMTVTMRCVDANFGALAEVLGPVAPQVHTAVVAGIGAAVSLDLAAALSELGVSASAPSTVEVAGSVVAVRFEPAGGAIERLFPDHEWGILLSCDLTLIPTPAQRLRTIVNWSFHAHSGLGIADTIAESAVANMFDPTRFGGTPAGDHAFFVESRLPDIEFADTRFRYASAIASPVGMTIGGLIRLLGSPVQLEDGLSWDILQASVPVVSRPDDSEGSSTWSIPQTIAFCSSGYSVGELKVTASVRLEHCGQFCGVEALSPGNEILQYLVRNDISPDDQTLYLHLPVSVATRITSPVRLLVRTARGVRLADLGAPHITLGEDGTPTNSYVSHIDDCLYIPKGGQGGWVDQHPEWNKWQPDLPDVRDGRDWEGYITGLRDLDVQLVQVTGLEPGELIQFLSREHAVNVSADIRGRAVVPVLLSIRDRLGPAKLTRVSRRPLEGLITVSTTVFHQQANLSAGQRKVDLPGLAFVIPVPGFADEPVVLARMTDGSTLVLDLATDGVPRVAGTFAGPIGELTISGKWALAVGQDRLTTYRITQS